MNVPFVKFNRHNRPEFFKVLSSRVNQYFVDKKISRHANFDMKFKTVFMLTLYTTPLVLMVTGVVSGLWPVIAMWAIMGFGMSGIGLAVMHDANHGSYSSSPKVNQLIGYVINYIGGFHVNWKIQHNVLHHSYTNVHGFDEDIDKGVIRFSPTQERKPIFRFQAFYAPFLYGIMSLYWLLAKDFQQLYRYSKNDLLKSQGMSFRKALVSILFNKAWYMVVIVALPLIFVDLPWWQTILGFLLMHFISGLVLALIFQPAHVIEETEFFMVDENGSIENDWAIHQMRTTSNFAHNSKFFSWFVGGLNYQIEHHLFPNICHVHYKHISKIVQATAAEFNIPYHQHETFYGAVRSHFSLLHSLGTGAYDKAQKKSAAAF